MIKTVTAISQVEPQFAAEERKDSDGVLFLIVKNTLFWGSIGLTCYAIYAGASHLFG
jgi:hypothetical protein